MRKRVILIQPPFERLMGYSRFYTHPGLLSLAAVVEAGGHEVLVYDADYNPNGTSYNSMEMMDSYDKYIEELYNFCSPVWDEIKNVLKDFYPDYVGITVLTVTQDSARKIAGIAREINPGVVIITGGVHPTISPSGLENYADFIIQHEGENVILDIMDDKFNKGIIRGTRVRDLDSLPFPAVRRLYGLGNYERKDLSLVMSSRGCPNSCKFCNSQQIWERRVTRKSVGRFIEEIKILKNEFGVEDFFISDDSFAYNKEWLYSFCTEVKKLGITWRCLDRIDHVSDETLDMMMEAGCRNIKFGIESGSQRILDMVNKRIQVENVLKANEILKRKGMNWSAFFMIGFPGETEKDILETQDLIRIISAKSMTLSVFTPFPGNELLKSENIDYKLYSHHSPYNNFTGVIDDKRFKELVEETLKLTYTGYVEHTDSIMEVCK